MKKTLTRSFNSVLAKMWAKQTPQVPGVSALASAGALTPPLQAVSLIAEERTIKGSYVGSCVPSRDIPRLIAMYRAGRLPVRALLSETISLEQINPALDRLARGEAVRQVILPHGG